MTNKAILLVNLGSPDKPDTQSVRKYLNQFLMDPYVIQLPWLLRRLIVSLFVLPSRPRSSASAYQSIWLNEGSPLVVLSEKLKQKLQNKLTDPVTIAMRYGQPSIERQLLALTQKHDIEEIIFVPLYPHYAESTVKTSIEEARRVINTHQLPIKLTIVQPFYDNDDYIQALVTSAQDYLIKPYDHIVFSYHGLPESHITKLSQPRGGRCLQSDQCCETVHPAHQFCYRHQVIQTTKLFVKKANIPSEKYSIAFQSRLGRAKWLGPNTEDCLRKLAENGKKNILVICPAFTTDCLETLEEIAMRGKEVFCEAGGEELTLIPCLNDHPEWVNVLASWCGQSYTRPNKG